MTELLGRLSPAVGRWIPYEWAKRAIDLGFIVLFAPAILLALAGVAILVGCQGGPLLYGQQRTGRNGRPFTLWKFRTMHPSADALLARCLAQDPELRREWEERAKLRQDPRVTPLGQWLRRYSLDELPQFWCVLRGEMSLVGPRPVPEAELRRHYGPVAAAYLSCRPGLTGLWQVSGRSGTSYAHRVALDATYSLEKSTAVDLLILCRTVGTVLRGTGC